MDDSPGVAIVNPIDELIKEKLDLILRDGVLVLRHIFLEIVVNILKDQVKFFVSWLINNLIQTASINIYLTMLG